MTRARLLMAIALAAALAGAPAGARVFWQFGGGVSSRGLVEAGEANWSRANTTPLRINGGRADMNVWSTPQSIEETLTTLRQRVNDRSGQMYFAAGDDLAWGIGVVEDRVLRFLISTGPGRTCHVMELVQDFADYRASRTAPTAAGLPDVPEMPEARVSQVLANESTGLTLATTHSAAPPAAARQQANAVLAGAGWQLLMSAGGQAGVYVRGRDLLVVSAVSAGRDGETVVTLAHKRRAAVEGP